MQAGTRGEVTVHIDALPMDVYALISNVTRMGEWSPECVDAQWVDGATEPAVGARFRGRNRHGLARWSNKPRVTGVEPGREFSFVVGHLGRDMTRWTYRLEPSDGGTDVTESFELLASLPFYLRWTDRFAMGVKDRKADLEANMRETLNRLKAAAEHGNSMATQPRAEPGQTPDVSA